MSAALLEKIGEFLRRAQLCEQYARETSDELMRQQFLTTAEGWRKLAAEAERMASRMSGLSRGSAGSQPAPDGNPARDAIAGRGQADSSG
jgi:hypothetical protein